MLNKLLKEKIKEEIYIIETETGDKLTITGNHKILRRNGMFVRVDKIKGGKIYTNSLTTINDSEYIDTKEYDVGYLIGIIVGDGSLNSYNYDSRGNGKMYKFRIAMKDDEAIEKMLPSVKLIKY